MEKDKVIEELRAAAKTLRKAASVYGGDLYACLNEAAMALEKQVIEDVEDGTWSRLFRAMKENKVKDA